MINQKDKKGPKLKENKKLRLNRLSDLYKGYSYLKDYDDPQARGYELEKLVYRLFEISCGNVFSSYRASLEWNKHSTKQIDAAFNFFDQSFYRVETKWTSKPSKPTDIVLFRDKLDVVDVKGLFISIEGFTPEAVKKAYEFRNERQILLMDGEELEFILLGTPTLDEAMRTKQIYFAKDSNPYFKIKPVVQMDVA